MQVLPTTKGEARRLAALAEIEILDTPKEVVFDAVHAARGDRVRRADRTDRVRRRRPPVVQIERRLTRSDRNTALRSLLRLHDPPSVDHGDSRCGARSAIREQPARRWRTAYPLLRWGTAAIAPGGRPSAQFPSPTASREPSPTRSERRSSRWRARSSISSRRAVHYSSSVTGRRSAFTFSRERSASPKTR